VTGDGDHDGQAGVRLPCLEVGQQPGHTGGGRRLGEDPVAPGELRLGGQDLTVADRTEPAAGLVCGGLGLLP
jgi:hypothetical protein